MKFRADSQAGKVPWEIRGNINKLIAETKLEIPRDQEEFSQPGSVWVNIPKHSSKGTAGALKMR